MIYKLKCINNDEYDSIEFEQHNKLKHEICVTIFKNDKYLDISLNKNDVKQLIDALKVIKNKMTD